MKHLTHSTPPFLPKFKRAEVKISNNSSLTSQMIIVITNYGCVLHLVHTPLLTMLPEDKQVGLMQ